MSVTTSEILYHFDKKRQPSMLFDDIRKGKVKIVKVSDFQSKLKHQLSDIKRVIKAGEVLP